MTEKQFLRFKKYYGMRKLFLSKHDMHTNGKSRMYAYFWQLYDWVDVRKFKVDKELKLKRKEILKLQKSKKLTKTYEPVRYKKVGKRVKKYWVNLNVKKGKKYAK